MMVIAFSVVLACGQSPSPSTRHSFPEKASFIDTSGNDIATRFKAVPGYARKRYAENSFPYYLSHLPLKPPGENVRYYNGDEKANYNVYAGVVDMAIGDKDLHQCADAVMRLRAEYLYKTKQYDKIHFNFTNGFKVEYDRWRRGERIAVNGNKTHWVNTTKPSDGYDTFWSYLETIFMYAGTASLEKELRSIPIQQAHIGDVLIQGGFPGHAVIIIDKIYDHSSGKTLCLLAQSYMPAQEIQILKNPAHKDGNPWYDLSSNPTIKTPEWTFTSEDLKRF